jgi:hypothetical protein
MKKHTICIVLTEERNFPFLSAHPLDIEPEHGGCRDTRFVHPRASLPLTAALRGEVIAISDQELIICLLASPTANGRCQVVPAKEGELTQ